MDNKNLYQVIFDSMDEGVMIVGIDFTVMAVNKAWERITGYSRDDAIDKLCFVVCAGKYCKASCDIETAFETGRSIPDFEIAITDRQGLQKFVKIRTVLLKDQKGKPTGCLRILKDLTVLRRLQQEKGDRTDFFGIVGKSPQMQRIYELIDNIKDSSLPVLITGETGTGKELVCDAIHLSSRRSSGNLLKVNLSALPQGLIEAELFGYEKGAFTGADSSKVGRFEMADGGTIFLDEIGNTNEVIQQKLLRVIETKKFERVGGRKEHQVDIRIISATNLDLKQAVVQGGFRKDLFYRISAAPIQLPPLRERREDIPLLIEHFLNNLNQDHNKEKIIAPEGQRFLIEYNWPGNVRELKNLLEFVYLTIGGDKLQKQDFLGFLELERSTKPIGQNELDQKTKLIALLSAHQWNIQETAAAMNIDRTTIWRKMKKAGIQKNKLSKK